MAGLGVVPDLDGVVVGLRQSVRGHHLAHRADGQQVALLHQGDAVGVGGGERKVVDHKQNGCAVVAVVAQDVEDALLVVDVEGRGRFVEKHDRGRLRECATQRDACLLASGELSEGALGDLVEMAQPHRLGDDPR